MAEKGTTLVGKGLFLWVVLTEGSSPGGPPATVANLKQWIERVPQYYTGTLDSVAPQQGLEDYFGVQRDHMLLIDLSTMTLVDMFDSDPQGALDAAAKMLP